MRRRREEVLKTGGELSRHSIVKITFLCLNMNRSMCHFSFYPMKGERKGEGRPLCMINGRVKFVSQNAVIDLLIKTFVKMAATVPCSTLKGKEREGVEGERERGSKRGRGRREIKGKGGRGMGRRGRGRRRGRGGKGGKKKREKGS